MSTELLHPNDIDKELFNEISQDFPAIAWQGKVSDLNKIGFWTMDQEGLVAKPNQLWEATSHRFGTDPNSAPKPIYTTMLLRCVPLGVRKRIIIKDDSGGTHFYPWKTPKANRVAGRFKSHYQIMVVLPEMPDPLVIGLKGMTRTYSWSNNPQSRFGHSEFPVGVEEQLRSYSEKASKQQKTHIPWLCTWMIDLVPWMDENNSPRYVQVGRSESQVWMNPFTVDLRTGGDLPTTRFVGREKFIHYQDMRKEIALPWEKEWNDAQSVANNGEWSDSELPEPIKV